MTTLRPRTIDDWHHLFAWIAAVSLALAAGPGCSGTSKPPKVTVSLYGWAAEGGSGGGPYVGSLGDYPEAQKLTVKLTRPKNGEILEQKTVPVGKGEVELPELSVRQNVRLDFDVIGTSDGRGERIAAGATPIFSPDESGSTRQFQVMLSPVRAFAPAYAQFAAGSSSYDYDESTFDDRGAGGSYLGRVGHRAVRTGPGNVLVVGGATISSNPTPGQPPGLQAVHSDVQEFGAAKGYVTDLSYDPENEQTRSGDRLSIGRAYHTVTRIGPEKFVVIGGFTKQSGNLGLVGTIEMIDLTKKPGNRVREMNGSNGALRLSTSRARHTATYLPEADLIVVAGGVGSNGSPVSSVEIVDVADKAVRSGPSLASARAQHRAIRMGDGESTIWLIGGRDGSSALSSTEIIRTSDSGLTSSSAAGLSTARYHLAAKRLSPTVAIVCGGYTTLGNDGAPADTCRIGNVEQNRWTQTIEMPTARGGLDLVRLTQSRNLVAIGGRGIGGAAVLDAARLNFQGRDAAKLYQVETGVGTMFKSRYEPTVTRLQSGEVLLTGGVGFTDTSGSNTEECRRGDPPNCGRATLRSFEYYNPGDVVQVN